MKWMVLLGLAAQLFGATVLFDGDVTLGKSSWKAVSIGPSRAPVRLECTFQSANGGPSLRLLLLTREEAERFRDKLRFQPIAETTYSTAGSLRRNIGRPGDLLVVLENGSPDSRAMQARLRVALIDDDNSGVRPRTLSPARRAVVVATSLVFFFGVCVWSGRKLWRATRDG